MLDQTGHLTQLGSYAPPPTGRTDCSLLEVFPNRWPGRSYTVGLECPEFTSLCPKTGQPDFATVDIVYEPDKLCVETKSLKLYLQSYRQAEGFMETFTNQILADLVAAARPRTMTVTAKYNPRGGIRAVVVAAYRKEEDPPC